MRTSHNSDFWLPAGFLTDFACGKVVSGEEWQPDVLWTAEDIMAKRQLDAISRLLNSSLEQGEIFRLCIWTPDSRRGCLGVSRWQNCTFLQCLTNNWESSDCNELRAINVVFYGLKVQPNLSFLITLECIFYCSLKIESLEDCKSSFISFICYNL